MIIWLALQLGECEKEVSDLHVSVFVFANFFDALSVQLFVKLDSRFNNGDDVVDVTNAETNEDVDDTEGICSESDFKEVHSWLKLW